MTSPAALRQPSEPTPLDGLIGCTIEAAYRHEDTIFLVLADGAVRALVPVGDCCANCYIAQASLTDALVVARVTSIEALECSEEELEYGDVRETFGYRIHTTRGTCTLDMRVEHNGYYGGQLELCDDRAIPEGAVALEDF